MTDIISADQLRLLIERIERLEEDKKAISDDIKDVYGEAKSTGFDVKTIRTIVQLRKMEKHHRDEAEMLLDTYKAALGLAMCSDWVTSCASPMSPNGSLSTAVPTCPR